MSQIQSFTEERAAIETRFNNCFDNSIVPVQYDNVAFLKNGDQVLSDSSKCDEWVRLSIINADATQQEVGSSRTRVYGIVVCSVFVRENKGSNKAREIADNIFGIFNGTSEQGIQFRTTRLSQTPPSDGWFQMTLETEYYWDRCPC